MGAGGHQRRPDAGRAGNSKKVKNAIHSHTARPQNPISIAVLISET